MKLIELIKWVDSYGCSSSWGTIESINISRQFCYSAGFVLKEDDEYIVVASHYHEANEANGAEESACGDMTIPKCCIIERSILVQKYIK